METEASLFFKELSCMYEAAHLGSHRHLDSNLLDEPPRARGAATGPALAPASCNIKEAIIPVKPAKAQAPAGSASSSHRPQSPFEEACHRALRGLVKKIEEEMQSEPGNGPVVPVLYILEPDFSLGNPWSLVPRPHSPAKARAEWRRSLAKAIALLAGNCSSILDLVVQVVPAQRINVGRKMQWRLRDLAMAVYSKARVRQRVKPEPQTLNPKPLKPQGDIEVDDETLSFFSGAMMSMKRMKKFFDSRLHEPLVVTAHVARQLSHRSQAEQADAQLTEESVAAKSEEPLVLHCCYVWSNDGLCLGAAVTDVTGEMLETFTALYNPAEARATGLEAGHDVAWRSMIQKLWNCLYEWMRISDHRPVRLVIASLGSSLDLARDIMYWNAVLEKTRCGAGDPNCCEVAFVQLGVLRSLQLLSWCIPCSHLPVALYRLHCVSHAGFTV